MILMNENNKLIKENNDLNVCSYINWYKKFDKISIESICIKIPDDVENYLLDEIIILPKECTNGQSNEHHEGYDDDFDQDMAVPEFQEFSSRITDKISALGGSAFVKTNWHCPKDASWITAGQTMRVQDITDVYQLLKASSLCKEDLRNQDVPPISGCDPIQHYLVLKKWIEIHPGSEFRCFVRDNNLIAISPRDWPQYHAHILVQKDDIMADIVTMFKEHIKGKFPLCDYIFDVVREQKDKVLLVDFSPFGPRWSDSLAYEWDDFGETDDENEFDDEPEFRYLVSDCGIQPRKRNNYGFPKDVIEAFQTSPSSSSNNDSNDVLITLLQRELNMQSREPEDD